jgi:arsenate reductase
MTAVTLYHNPRCSKSRATLALLEERDIDFSVVEYLQQPLTADELKALAAKLDVSIRDFMRSGEAAFKELKLADPSLSDDDLLAAMAQHPILMQRPILVNGDKARIGRPPENVLEIV